MVDTTTLKGVVPTIANVNTNKCYTQRELLNMDGRFQSSGSIDFTYDLNVIGNRFMDAANLRKLIADKKSMTYIIKDFEQTFGSTNYLQLQPEHFHFYFTPTVPMAVEIPSIHTYNPFYTYRTEFYWTAYADWEIYNPQFYQTFPTTATARFIYTDQEKQKLKREAEWQLEDKRRGKDFVNSYKGGYNDDKVEQFHPLLEWKQEINTNIETLI